MNPEDNTIGLSRRKMLVGLGAVGVASAGAGLGTTAYFSDEESFEGNTITAGELDLFVDYEASYDSDGAVENMADSASGTQDGDPAGIFYDLQDVKPGDSGHVEFCFRIVDNPSYVWACGDLTQDENGITEPESHVDDTPDLSELGDSIDARLVYCERDGEDIVEGDEIVSGSLVDVFAALSGGAALDGDGVPGLVPGEQGAYDTLVDDGDGDFITGPCVCLFWEIPTSVGNEIQSDALTMGLEFHAVQSRHNDGSANPCVDVEKVDGDGWGKVEIDDFGTSDMQAKIRSPYSGVEQFADSEPRAARRSLRPPKTNLRTVSSSTSNSPTMVQARSTGRSTASPRRTTTRISVSQKTRSRSRLGRTPAARRRRSATSSWRLTPSWRRSLSSWPTIRAKSTVAGSVSPTSQTASPSVGRSRWTTIPQ